jgi:hypothetical protein
VTETEKRLLLLISRPMRAVAIANNDAASLRLILIANNVISPDELNRSQQQLRAQLEKQLEPLNHLESLAIEDLDKILSQLKPLIQ